ncbi:MAG: 16S rRNA (uracil(1498)-N(3))-methyltransferase [Bacteroidetes bacterium CG2_30_32_10]|nr:MAG: 16S rRNA (uracil(1498)-N(3))-methyltransferase [Bacteroidetes bacterium CG2_30_32_10]
MHLFYATEISSDFFTLAEEEARHCLKVLRLKKNDTIYLTDGLGNLFTALVDSITLKECVVRITDIQREEKQKAIIHLAVSPTKNIDRFEWFLEKATEIGIDVITPIICERSERQIIKPERLNKILISALKQSLKTYLPELRAITPFDKLITSANEQTKLIAHCLENDKKNIKELYIKGNSVLIIIGPEGDFSEGEIKKAIHLGFNPVTLGKSRLRTETAAIVACHSLNFINEF